MVLISACLIGINCNYKGESKPCEKAIKLARMSKAIPFCPEQLGGLCTPRSGARILSGNGLDVLDKKARLITDDSKDVTDEYIKGAEKVLKMAKIFNISAVVLKQGSPSCGNGKTQGGESKRERVLGDGVTTALLKKNGIKIYSEEDLENKDIWRKLSG